ncbi:MAG: nuclease-related domain-containing protein [Gammaproteobacteria bacterium]|jgi:hypothetical protein
MTTSDISQYGASLPEHYLLLTAVSLAALVIITFLSRARIRSLWLNIKTRHRINRMGLKQISNLQCPDGLGHHFVIDRLLLRQDGISLLVFKQYPGSIFCADNIDEWTQMIGGKRYPFKNPLIDLEYQVKAVSACVPDIPVNGYLYFDHHARFPKGHPERVIHLDNIPPSLQRHKKVKPKAAVESAWKKICALKTA